jgi:drug/metabolite transporter (DMT)-like permease
VDISSILTRMAPVVFVVLWSTGYIGAKLGLPYAEPFTFLALRMALTLCILVPVVAIFVKANVSLATWGHSMVSGMLIHGAYLGAIFFAISRGMPAGISAMVIALQPLVTVIVARVLLSERIATIQLAAFVVALGGVGLVLSPKLAGGQAGEGLTTLNIVCVFGSVVAISLGSVYQKRFSGKTDLRITACGQYLGALIPLLIFSFLFETREIEWSGEFIFALVWLIFVLSIGAVSLLMFLIRRDSAGQTASLFYLVPVVTSLMSWALFDETLLPVQLAGMGIVVAAVAWSSRKAQKNPAS